MEAKLTEYKGVYFRSKLEVKWCKFFELLGVRFEYEKEVVNSYVPDFYFRSIGLWVEIKGKRPTDKEMQKLMSACKSTNKCGMIISGYPDTYPFSLEPHMANCLIYFITPKGKKVKMSADEIYQITKNEKILFLINNSNTDHVNKLNTEEYIRCLNIIPAKAKFKPKSKILIKDLRLIKNIFKKLSKRIDKYSGE